MSLIPILFDLVDDMYEPLRDFNFLDIGNGSHPQIRASHGNSPSSYLRIGMPTSYRRRWTPESNGDGQLGIPTTGKEGFQVCMDVQHFKPNEITVKTVDNQVIIEGKHEERQDDHGYISRHFIRKYTLPENYDAKEVVSTLSSDGVLTVKAPQPIVEAKNNERIVQIQQTGPALLNVKQNPKNDESEIKLNNDKKSS